MFHGALLSWGTGRASLSEHARSAGHYTSFWKLLTSFCTLKAWRNPTTQRPVRLRLTESSKPISPRSSFLLFPANLQSPSPKHETRNTNWEMLFRAISGRSVLRQDFRRVYETLFGQVTSDRKLFLSFFLCSKVIHLSKA